MVKSLLSDYSLQQLIDLIKSTIDLNGEAAEVGIYQGGSALAIAQTLPSSTQINLFDTFEGMPHYDSSLDTHIIGDFSDVLYDKIVEIFKDYPNVSIYKGIFPIDVENQLNPKTKYKFVHLDVDNYQSYKDCLDYFYPKMVNNSIMLFDDYNWTSCSGANKAINEFFTDKPEKLETLEGGGAFIKKIIL